MNPSSPSRPASWPAAGPALKARTAPQPAAAVRAATARPAAEPALDAAATPWTIPFIVVLGYLLVDYGRPQDWFPPLRALRPGMIVLGAGIICLMYYRRMYVPRPAMYIMGFLALMAVNVPFATNTFRAFTFTKDFAIFLFGAIIPLMTFVETSKQTGILFRFWVCINLSLALYGIVNGGRGLGSFLGDENDFCLAINVALPYSFFLMSAARSTVGRLSLLGSMGFFLAAVVASFSRGGFIGLVTGGIACWWRSPRKVVSAVVVVVMLAGLSLTVPDKYWKEMQTIQNADQEGDTGHNRLYFWGLAWKMFKDHPILGVGPSNFQYNSYKYEDASMAAGGFHVWGRAAHSLYFTLLPEGGMVGVFLFTAVAVSGWRLRRGIAKGYKDLARAHPDAVTPELKELSLLSRAVDVSLLTYLVTGAFISVLYYPHFWLIAAFSVALRRAWDAEVLRTPLAAAPAMNSGVRPAWPGLTP